MPDRKKRKPNDFQKLDEIFNKSQVKDNSISSITVAENLNANSEDEYFIQQIAQIEADHRLALELQKQFESEMNAEEPSSANVHNINATASELAQTESVVNNEPTTKSTAILHNETSIENDEILENCIAINLDQNPFVFDVHKYRNNAVLNSKPVPYALLSHCFSSISKTRSRIKIVDILCNFLRLVIEYDPESLLPAVWLSTNSIGPQYSLNSELNLGPSIFNQALKSVTNISATELRKLWNKHGDPGDVAISARVTLRTLIKPKPLTIPQVYNSLVKISTSQGNGAQKKKQSICEHLLLSARGEEIRYISRTLMQHLRIGAVKATMLQSLVRAFSFTGQNWNSDLEGYTVNPEKAKNALLYNESLIKQCFARRPNYDDLIPTLFSYPIEDLPTVFSVTVGVPLKPMLGIITKGIDDALIRLEGQNFTCEYKYDGQRAQVHMMNDGKIKLFSRHLEDMTSKYPDLIRLFQELQRENKIGSLILEGEVVAIHGDDNAIQSFQVLANRGRKNVTIENIKVQVCFYAFDLMYLNGESLLKEPLKKRRELLHSTLREIPGRLHWAEHLDSGDQSEVEAFFQMAVKSKCEGIMIKLLSNENTVQTTKQGESKSRRNPILPTYECDRRAESWLKVKKDYSDGSDSLDLVPVGGWHGQGRKNKWYSPILLALKDDITGDLQTVCKCISGFSDAFYQKITEKYSLDGNLASKSPISDIVQSDLQPDVWFLPNEVWEIRGADITISPVYRAGIGLVHESKGLSLRFPRFIKVREDKSIEDATTAEELAIMFRAQQSFETERKK